MKQRVLAPLSVLLFALASLPPLVAQAGAPNADDSLSVVEAAKKDWLSAQAAASAGLKPEEWESDAEFADRKAELGRRAALAQRAVWEAAVTRLRSEVYAVPPEQVKLKISAYDAKSGSWTLSVVSQDPALPFSGDLALRPKNEAEFKKLNVPIQAQTLVARLTYRLFPGTEESSVYRALLTGVELGTAPGFQKLAALPAWWLGEFRAGARNKPVAVRVLEALRVEGGGSYFAPNDLTHRNLVVFGDGFFMAKTPVTQDQYLQVMGLNPSAHRDGFDAPRRPVDSVTLLQAAEFCNRLSLLEGLKPYYVGTGDKTRGDPTANGWRLPSYEQFWYAWQGGVKNVGHTLVGGETAAYLGANYNAMFNPPPPPVAASPPNELGLYDLLGTIAEWTNFEVTWGFKTRGWASPGKDGGVTLNFPSSGVSFRVVKP